MNRRFTRYLGPLDSIGLLALLIVTSLVLRKPPEFPKAEDLLALIESQNSISTEWDLQIPEPDSLR